MEGEAEYGFSHLLIRDVCYQQIPRAARVVRHRAAAAWLERRLEERVEDVADVLAHHYLTALELARAAGRTDEAPELEARAVRYLSLAGERALGLDVDRAEQQLSRALALCPTGDPERAPLLVRWARATQQQNRLREAKTALEEALEVYRERNEPVAGGRTLTQLANLLQRRLGDPHWQETIAEALTVLEAQPPGRELVEAYAQLASARSLSSAYAEAIPAAERAIQLAAELGLPEPPRAFGLRGLARCTLGDRQGLEDMRRALRLATERGSGHEAAVEHNNLAHVLWQYDGPRAALDALREGIEFCRRRGITEFALGMSGGSVSHLASLGETEQALNDAGPIADRLQSAGDVRFTEPRSLQLRLLTERGEQERAVTLAELVAAARDSGQPQRCARAFAAAAQLLLARDRPEDAHRLLAELDLMAGTRSNPVYASQLPNLVRTGLALDDVALAERLVDGVRLTTPLAEHALVACRAQLTEAAGNHAEAARLYAEAADRWQRFGDVPELAYALLGQGRCLAAVGRADAEEPLRRARERFVSLGYESALVENEALFPPHEPAAQERIGGGS
jgi:tetratricopeptide (TPR) repeat protein